MLCISLSLYLSLFISLYLSLSLYIYIYIYIYTHVTMPAAQELVYSTSAKWRRWQSVLCLGRTPSYIYIYIYIYIHVYTHMYISSLSTYVCVFPLGRSRERVTLRASLEMAA